MFPKLSLEVEIEISPYVWLNRAKHSFPSSSHISCCLSKCIKTSPKDCSLSCCLQPLCGFLLFHIRTKPCHRSHTVSKESTWRGREPVILCLSCQDCCPWAVNRDPRCLSPSAHPIACSSWSPVPAYIETLLSFIKSFTNNLKSLATLLGKVLSSQLPV